MYEKQCLELLKSQRSHIIVKMNYFLRIKFMQEPKNE